MKMVKSLLLGSAAGIVAMTGAQAADLPVKARAVEYVRICTIYGAGFYYIPGTDTCLKVGGYVRLDVGINAGGSHSPYVNGAGGRNNREAADYQTRVRGIVSWDARTQTEYGTLRAYINAGWELNSGDATYRGTIFFFRGFIQFAGLTLGKAQSFFGFYSNALNYSTLQGGGQSDAGLNLLAYTAQFAGGFSATISVEDGNHHRGGLWDANANGNGLTIGALPGAGPGLPGYGDYAATGWPDIVANLRVDQPWGSAQIAAAVHDVTALYNGPNMLGGTPSDEVGWAVTGGVKFNLPWAQGDEFWVQGTYARGATNYLGLNPFVHTGGQYAMYSGSPRAGCGPGPLDTGSCGNVGLAWTFDGVFDRAGIELVEGWSVLAALQHYWTPALRTSIFGHYTQLEYDRDARTVFCNGPAGSADPRTLDRCNPDFAIWQIGTRTIWSPVRNLDIGVEVLYTKLDQNHRGFWDLGSSGQRPAGLYRAADQDTWSGTVRFQRNFWP